MFKSSEPFPPRGPKNTWAKHMDLLLFCSCSVYCCFSLFVAPSTSNALRLCRRFRITLVVRLLDVRSGANEEFCFFCGVLPSRLLLGEFGETIKENDMPLALTLLGYPYK